MGIGIRNRRNAKGREASSSIPSIDNCCFLQACTLWFDDHYHSFFYVHLWDLFTISSTHLPWEETERKGEETSISVLLLLRQHYETQYFQWCSEDKRNIYMVLMCMCMLYYCYTIIFHRYTLLYIFYKSRYHKRTKSWYTCIGIFQIQLWFKHNLFALTNRARPYTKFSAEVAHNSAL